jgi:thymidylate kinase
MFVAIEGVKCCGKTTQVDLLAERILRTSTRGLLRLEFPSGNTVVYQHASNSVVRHCAILAEQYSNVPRIQDTLRAGGIVITSGWKAALSTLSLAASLDSDWVVNSQALLPEPDLNVLIDIKADEVVQRYLGPERSPVPLIAQYRHTWCTKMELNRFAWFRVDGMQSIAKVHEDIFNIIRAEFARREL